MRSLPLPPEELINKLPGAREAPPPAAEEAAAAEEGSDAAEPERPLVVDPVVFLEGLVTDRALRRHLHPSAKAALETILVAVAKKGGHGDLAVATSLLRVGDILAGAAEGRARALELAVEALRVALGLFGETLGRTHHVTVRARAALADALAAAGRRAEAALELETVLDASDVDAVAAAARTSLAKLDAHPTLPATVRRARRKQMQNEVDALKEAAPILYGRFAGKTPTDDDDAPGDMPRLADEASVETVETVASGATDVDAYAAYWRRMPHPEIAGASYFWNEATGETANDPPPGLDI